MSQGHTNWHKPKVSDKSKARWLSSVHGESYQPLCCYPTHMSVTSDSFAGYPIWDACLSFPSHPATANLSPLCLTFRWGQSSPKLPHRPNCRSTALWCCGLTQIRVQARRWVDIQLWEASSSMQQQTKPSSQWNKQALSVSCFTNTISCLGLAQQQTNQSSEAEG